MFLPRFLRNFSFTVVHFSAPDVSVCLVTLIPLFAFSPHNPLPLYLLIFVGFAPRQSSASVRAIVCSTPPGEYGLSVRVRSAALGHLVLQVVVCGL